ncbi:MAG: hypothetical protein KJO98_05000 [Rhodothermia bacterium]|nr:hypothetical protein [Rhodothermia bacterium]
MYNSRILRQSYRDGWRGLRKRPGLAALLYAVVLVGSVAISIPLYVILDGSSSSTGFGPYLVARFDMILITEIMQESSSAVLATVAMLAWLAPVVFIWKVASSVGTIHALTLGAMRSFWDGVGRFTGPGLLLSILNLGVFLVWLVLVIFIAAAVAALLPVGAAIEIPVAVAVGLVVIGGGLVGLMQDFARINLICEGRGVIAAWLEGIRFPLRHREVFALYGFWWLAAGALSGLLLGLHVSWASTIEAAWLLFLGHQALLVVRAAGTVAWTGSAVGMHEQIRFREAPLIALNDAIA